MTLNLSKSHSIDSVGPFKLEIWNCYRNINDCLIKRETTIFGQIYLFEEKNEFQKWLQQPITLKFPVRFEY